MGQLELEILIYLKIGKKVHKNRQNLYRNQGSQPENPETSFKNPQNESVPFCERSPNQVSHVQHSEKNTQSENNPEKKQKCIRSLRKTKLFNNRNIKKKYLESKF